MKFPCFLKILTAKRALSVGLDIECAGRPEIRKHPGPGSLLRTMKKSLLILRSILDSSPPHC